MDPRKLLYLVSVIEHGSFTKASRELHISQPGLSASIDRLEQSLGSSLLDRGPTGVTPTPLGELLYAHARLIRDELELAEKRMTGVGNHSPSEIVFGTLPTLAASIVPRAVCQWRKTHSLTTLHIVEKIQPELLLSLLRGELDFIIAQTGCYDSIEALKQRVLFRDRLHIIARANHPAFRLRSPTWADLVQFPWILQMIGKQRSLLERLLASGMTLPQELTECGSVDCIKSLIEGSDSLAPLPASAIATDVRQGRFRPFDINTPLLNRDIAVLFHERSPLSSASRDLVADIQAAGLDMSRQDLVPCSMMATAS